MKPFARSPIESVPTALRRIGIGLLTPAILAVAFWLIRPGLVFQLARLNVGNWTIGPFLEEALSAKHPELVHHDADHSGAAGFMFADINSRIVGSYRTSRGGCFALADGDGRLQIIDDELNIRATIRADWLLHAADDRDGDPNADWEALVNASSVGSSAGGYQWALAVVKLGAERHRLLAAVRISVTTSAPFIGASPVWTNNDRDAQHELEWIQFNRSAGVPATATSPMKLHWLAPGRLALEGSLPPGYELWLPPPDQEMWFGADEPLEDVIRRAFDKQSASGGN